MMMREKELEWLNHQTKECHLNKNDISGLIEDLEDEGKLGQGFFISG
jgi:hypothetical protein